MPFQPFEPDSEVDIRRAHLPHWRQQGTTYFITTRLADSLPAGKLNSLRAEQETWLRIHHGNGIDELSGLPKAVQDEFHRRFTMEFHRWLDAGHGSCLLRDSTLANVVADSLRYFDRERYLLDAFVVMPNHAHFLIMPSPEHPLHEILRSLKGYTARMINKLAQRTGTLWQQESFDHIVRSREQLERFRHYIAENPVKARLKPGEFVLGPPNSEFGGPI